MEQQIQDLIASIRKEGIEEAKKESERIISEAKAAASDIVAKAEAEKDKILDNAKKSIALERQSSESAIKQAARDVSLSLKKSIEDSFQAILSQKVDAALSQDVLVRVLEAVVKAEVTSSNVYVELSADDFKALSAKLAESFKEQVKNGMEFRTSSSLSSGFRVVEKDGSFYVDMSGDECSKLLFPYLSASLRELL